MQMNAGEHLLPEPHCKKKEMTACSGCETAGSGLGKTYRETRQIIQATGN